MTFVGGMSHLFPGKGAVTANQLKIQFEATKQIMSLKTEEQCSKALPRVDAKLPCLFKQAAMNMGEARIKGYYTLSRVSVVII